MNRGKINIVEKKSNSGVFFSASPCGWIKRMVLFPLSWEIFEEGVIIWDIPACRPNNADEM